MKTFPLISVYIVSHKYGKYVERAIESVLKQTYKNFELILIDNGSEDETLEIFHRYINSPKVSKVIPITQNVGLIKAANIAIQNSDGEFIIRLDGDDFFEDQALSLLEGVSEDREAVYSGYFDFSDNEDHLKVHTCFDATDHGAGCLIRKSFLKKIGGYDEEFDCQDGYYLYRRLKIEGAVIGYRNQPLFYYRQHAENFSKNLNKIMETREKIEKKYVI